MSTPVLPSEVAWSANLWAQLRDRGVWGVPRSGLIFQKREAERVLAVTARMPHMPELPMSAEQLTEQQDSDVEAIRRRFEPLDIAVVDETREGTDG
jgi:hypothetical protein